MNSMNQKQHHVDYFKETVLPIFQSRYDVTVKSLGVYQIKSKTKLLTYDLYNSLLRYKGVGKPMDFGVDGLIGRVIKYLG